MHELDHLGELNAEWERQTEQQIANSIAHPDGIRFLREDVNGTAEPKSKITFTELSMPRVRFIMMAMSLQLARAIDDGRNVNFRIVTQLRPEIALEQHRRFSPDSPPPDTNEQNFVEHEIAHIQRAAEVGVKLEKAKLEIFFIEGGFGLGPSIHFIFEEEGLSPIDIIKIGLAPEKLSSHDVQKILDTIIQHSEFFKQNVEFLKEIAIEFTTKATKGSDL